MALYREYRPTLEQSMETVKHVKSRDELISLIFRNKKCNKCITICNMSHNFVIILDNEPFCKKTGWKNCNVLANYSHDNAYEFIGFLSEPF